MFLFSTEVCVMAFALLSGYLADAKASVKRIVIGSVVGSMIFTLLQTVLEMQTLQSTSSEHYAFYYKVNMIMIDQLRGSINITKSCRNKSTIMKFYLRLRIWTVRCTCIAMEESCFGWYLHHSLLFYMSWLCHCLYCLFASVGSHLLTKNLSTITCSLCSFFTSFR